MTTKNFLPLLRLNTRHAALSLNYLSKLCGLDSDNLGPSRRLTAAPNPDPSRRHEQESRRALERVIDALTGDVMSPKVSVVGRSVEEKCLVYEGQLTEIGDFVYQMLEQMVAGTDELIATFKEHDRVHLSIAYRNALWKPFVAPLLTDRMLVVDAGKKKIQLTASSFDPIVDSRPRNQWSSIDISLQYSPYTGPTHITKPLLKEQLHPYQNAVAKNITALADVDDYIMVERGPNFTEQLEVQYYPRPFLSPRWHFGTIQHAIEHWAAIPDSVIHLSDSQLAEVPTDAANPIKLTDRLPIEKAGIERVVFLVVSQKSSINSAKEKFRNAVEARIKTLVPENMRF